MFVRVRSASKKPVRIKGWSFKMSIGSEVYDALEREYEELETE